MAAAADAKGLKRICTSCGTRFYDMKKRPITCPGCNEEFTGEAKIKTRRGRVALVEKEADKKTKEEVSDETEIKMDDDTVSLDDIKEQEDAGDEGDEDIGLEDDGLEDLEEIDEDELDEDIEGVKSSKDD